MHLASFTPSQWLLYALLAGMSVAMAIEPGDLDSTVKPSGDFFQYANGGWLSRNEIPPEYPIWDATLEIIERNNAVLHDMLKEAAAAKNPPDGSVTQLVGDFYASGMDEKAIAAAGLEPLAPEFERIAAVDGPESLARELAHLAEIGTDAGFAFGSTQDAKDSESVIAGVFQDGLGLPERDYYFRAEDREVRAAYLAHVARMFELIGEPKEEAAANARTVLDLETKLAKVSLPAVELRDPEALYHKVTPAELQEVMPDFPWPAYFDELGIAEPPAINVAQPEFFRTFGRMTKEVPLKDWRTYLRWHLISAAAPYLPEEFVNQSFDFYGRELAGTEELRPRWKRVMSAIDNSVGEALGQLYVKEMFTPEAKRRMLELVANLRAALRDRIEHLSWMGAETKKAALEKLDAMRVKIGYPDAWRDYTGLKIDRGPYVQNVFRSNVFEFQRDLAKIGRPLDRGEWYMTPQTVNAYYDPTMNEVVFPAGILQSPFFDVKADDATNYGGIGATIGHEMTHGFDDEGRKYDAKGNLSNWWTAKDLQNFESRRKAIVAQFDGYEPVDGLKINGKLTAGENIADLGGLRIALDALKKTNPAPDAVDGFTPEQRFFLAYAQSWRSKERDEILRLQVKTDPHSPAKFRVNGPLANMPEFFEAFDIPADAQLVRPGAERVIIW